MSKTITLRMDAETRELLAAAHRLTGRTRTFLLLESARRGMPGFVRDVLEARRSNEAADLQLFSVATQPQEAK